jgi:uncharacterized MAPEG superfamily protein
MNPFTLDNPVFATFTVVSALLVLKVMGQGWMTVHRMMKSSSGFAAPEDLRPGLLNRQPNADQLAPNDYVERSRRIHRNDLENIPAFWASGALLVAVDPLPWPAQALMIVFLVARLAHFLAYATAQSHEIRATCYTIGSVSVIAMAVWVILAVMA